MHRSIRLLARHGPSLLRRQLQALPGIGVVPERLKYSDGGSGVKGIKGRKFNVGGRKQNDDEDGDDEQVGEDKEFSIDDRYESGPLYMVSGVTNDYI